VWLAIRTIDCGIVAMAALGYDGPWQFSEVTVRRARLILRWVTACRQVNHLGM